MLAKQGWFWSLIVIGSLALCQGCAPSAAPDGATAGNSSEEDNEGRPNLLTTSITRPDGEDDDEEAEDVELIEPEENSAEWQIREIVKLRLMPYPALPKPKDEKSEKNLTEEEQAAKEYEFQAAARRERNLQVINMAKQAIGETINKPEKELVFNVAVNHLLDSRLQLALAGDQQDVDDLYEIADALQQSKPNTDVAAAAALTIVNFSHANAVRYAQTEPKWIQEFARQAQLFANRVAETQKTLTEEETKTQRGVQVQQDASRASQILLAAGQSCEAAGFGEEGKACYLLLRSKFPESAPAQQATGIVRRLNLKGQPLQLAGPTLDGNFLSIEEFKGKTVLIVFWSSQAKPFIDQLPALTDLLKRAQKHVTVVGVNLDTDESQVDAFLEMQGLNWPQIFYSEPDKRGWNSPLASYYGISSLPTVWIVDSAGLVAETDITAANVEAKLKEAVRQSLKTGKTATTGTIQQAGSSTGGK